MEVDEKINFQDKKKTISFDELNLDCEGADFFLNDGRKSIIEFFRIAIFDSTNPLGIVEKIKKDCTISKFK